MVSKDRALLPPPPPGTKCRATAKRTGNPCRNDPIEGGFVCAYHGGSAPQTRAAAMRRLQRQQLVDAAADAALLWEDLEAHAAEIGPTNVLLDAVARAHAWAQVVGAHVAALDPLATAEDATGYIRVNRAGDHVPSAWVTMYDRAIDQAARLAKAAVDAGVAETLVRVEQDKARTLASVINAVLADPEMQLTEEQRARAPQVFGRHLRVIASG